MNKCLKLFAGLIGLASSLCTCAQPAFADSVHVGGQLAQGISDFGIGTNNTGKTGGLTVDWVPEINYPFARHLRVRAFLGLGTTNNIASGQKFPIIAIQPGIRADTEHIFADVYPFGIAYAPNPKSGSDYQFVFELDAGFHARHNMDVYVFWKHLSNGDTMKPNPGLDYWGVGLSLSWDEELKTTGE